MTHDERARKLVERIHARDDDGYLVVPPHVAAVWIAEALRTVELEALERAAKVADGYANTDVIGRTKDGNSAGKATASEVAYKIRSLKEQTQDA